MAVTTKKTWTESERQGRGRRFWFGTVMDAMRFGAERRRRGYHAVHDGRTVWVSFGKRLTRDVVEQRAGRDPEEGR